MTIAEKFEFIKKRAEWGYNSVGSKNKILNQFLEYPYYRDGDVSIGYKISKIETTYGAPHKEFVIFASSHLWPGDKILYIDKDHKFVKLPIIEDFLSELDEIYAQQMNKVQQEEEEKARILQKMEENFQEWLENFKNTH